MKQEKALLMDVLKLRFLYSDDEFECVINILKNKDQDPTLISILELVKALDEQQPKKNQPATNYSIESLTEIDPTKYALLKEAEATFNNKKVFPTVADLRKYVSTFLKLTGKKTKAELICLCLEKLSSMAGNELELEIIKLKEKPNTPSNDNSFMRMANKIVEAKRG